jgi:hypothetical protein
LCITCEDDRTDPETAEEAGEAKCRFERDALPFAACRGRGVERDFGCHSQGSGMMDSFALA